MTKQILLFLFSTKKHETNDDYIKIELFCEEKHLKKYYMVKTKFSQDQEKDKDAQSLLLIHHIVLKVLGRQQGKKK